MKTPKFLDIRFDSMSELNDWLKKTATFKINLVDLGQDLLTIWVHGSGEILYTDLQSKIWTGKFIDMKSLRVGTHLLIWDKEENFFRNYEKLQIESLVSLN
jgi:hypothetical protein